MLVPCAHIDVSVPTLLSVNAIYGDAPLTPPAWGQGGRTTVRLFDSPVKLCAKGVGALAFMIPLSTLVLTAIVDPGPKVAWFG